MILKFLSSIREKSENFVPMKCWEPCCKMIHIGVFIWTVSFRQSQDKQIETRIEDVQEKLGVAISTLQQAIGGINEQVSSSANMVCQRLNPVQI